MALLDCRIVLVFHGLPVTGLALILVLFPNGSPPSRWWFIPVGLVVTSWFVLGELGEVASAVWFGFPVGVVVAALALIVCAAAPIVRFRRASGVERSQLRWLGFAAGITAFAGVVAGVGYAANVTAVFEPAAGVLLIGSVVGLPAAILVAILRYRLFVIDRFVSRTVTYAVVAVLVSAVYAVPVLLAPRVLGSSNDVVTAMATLAAAVAFSPLRRRVRVFVDRRFNRSSFNAAREADRFAANVRDEVEVRAITTELTQVVVHTLQPQTIAVWLASGR